ncbi:hypothetical protein MMC14_001449 [Varicellaria rhodocarpa]|nr:hypothetical protein [Varicellaria rhodocarpa]
MPLLLRPSQDEAPTWNQTPSISPTRKFQSGFISYMIQLLVLVVILFIIALLKFFLRRRRRCLPRLMDRVPLWNTDECSLSTVPSTANNGRLKITEGVSSPSGFIRGPIAAQTSIGQLSDDTCTTETTLRVHVPSLSHQTHTQQLRVFDSSKMQDPARESPQFLPAYPVMNHTHHPQGFKLVPHPESPSIQENFLSPTPVCLTASRIYHHPLPRSSTLPLPVPTIRRYSYPFDDPASDQDPDLEPTTLSPTFSAPPRSRTFPVETRSLRKDSLMQTRGWRRHVMVVGGPPG